MLRQGSRLFALAMGRGDPAAEDRLLAFVRLLADGGLARFVGAETAGRVVGFGALVTYKFLGWIGFMGTEPEMQGRGIGSAILARLIGEARGLGIRSLRLDATDTGKKLYRKHGFREEYPGRMLEIPARCLPPGTAPSQVTLAGDLPEWCAALDRRAFGEDRSALIRLLLSDGGKVLVAGTEGFGILYGRKLGPVVATNVDAALNILWRAGDLGARVIYVPIHPDMPEPFLKALRDPEGDGQAGCCTRMAFGQPVRDESALVYAAHSAATG